MSRPRPATEDREGRGAFITAYLSCDRRLMEMSQKTAEEEERYRKEMEK